MNPIELEELRVGERHPDAVQPPENWKTSDGRRVLFGADGSRLVVEYKPGSNTFIGSTNINSADTINVEMVHDPGLDLSGDGVIIGVWEAGGVIRDTHQELVNRVDVRDPVVLTDHATHVAGTLAASGVDPNALGMAPDAELISYDADDDLAEMGIEAADGLQLSNHSYGTLAGWFGLASFGFCGVRHIWLGDRSAGVEDATFGKYQNFNSDLDDVLADNPQLLSVFAAGNDRNDVGTAIGGTYVARFATNPGIANLLNCSSGTAGWTGDDFYRVNVADAPLPGGDAAADGGFDTLLPTGISKNSLDATDLVLTGPGAAGAVVGTPQMLGSGDHWRFPVTGLSTPGQVNVSLAPDINDIKDSSGNILLPRPTTWSFDVVSLLPKIAHVRIRSSANNPANTLNPYIVPSGSGEQLKTVPVGGVDRITIRFNMPVDVVAQDLIVQGIGDLSGTDLTNHTYTAADLAANGFVLANGPSGTFDATWTYNSLLSIDQYLITLRDGILDDNGIPLDGDWADPPTSYTDPNSSSFPSGDGRSGGDFEFGFTILPDFDADNLAQFSDFVILSDNFDQTGAPFADGDFDGDGVVQFSDFTALSEAFGLDFQQWPSGSESMMQGGGGIVWTDSQREEALKAYHDLVEAGKDHRKLAMGRHLLRKMWDSLEQEDWLRETEAQDELLLDELARSRSAA